MVKTGGFTAQSGLWSVAGVKILEGRGAYEKILSSWVREDVERTVEGRKEEHE